MTMNAIPPPAFAIPTAGPVAPVAPTPSPAAAGPAPNSGPNDINQQIELFRRLRDKMKEISDRHDQELAPYKEASETLRAALLDHLNRASVESVNTKAGTAYKTLRTTYSVKDPAAFREWLDANQAYDVLAMSVTKEAIEERLKQGHPLPPGIGVSNFVTVNVRASK